MQNSSHTYQQVLNQLDNHNIDTIEPTTWLLLGTAGCHLCNEAENLLRLFNATCPISLIKVDIMDLDDSLLTQFATKIPIILTTKQQLNYPFSIVELHRAYSA